MGFSRVVMLGVLLMAGDPALGEGLARVDEIHGQPVTVTSSKTGIQAAQVGMELFAGDQVRTGSQSRAQVQRQNGFFVRVGSNAVLTLLPENQLQFSQGRMITWVEQPLARPVRILTPVGVAAIQGTTVFVDAPEHGRWVRFFSWEGTVTVSSLDGKQRVTLVGGQSVIVPSGSFRLPRPYRPADLRQQFEGSLLLHGFADPPGTMDEIRAMLDSPDAAQ